MFLVLAIVFPFWLDHVKRSQDEADFEAAGEVEYVPRPLPSPASPGAAPGGHLPYSDRANAECQAYVTARCNALGIRPGLCGEIEGVAMQVPLNAGLLKCRDAVEGQLRQAADYAGSARTSMPEPELPASPGGSQGRRPASAPGVRPGETGGGQAGEPVNRPSGTRKELTPEDKADNLMRVHLLVEELQRASQNYATLPASQRERFAELQNRVQADGSPEMRRLFNQLLKQHGRTAWYDVGKAGLKADESQRVEAGSGAERVPATTPEMDQVRDLINKTRKEAGLPAKPPPTLGPSSAPSFVEPSSVEAAPARSL